MLQLKYFIFSNKIMLIIKGVVFHKIAHAEKVSAYLPNTTVKEDCLRFLEFDRPAFELAISLEGLTEADYTIIYDERPTHLELDEDPIKHPIYKKDKSISLLEISFQICKVCVDEPNKVSLTGGCKYGLVVDRSFKDIPLIKEIPLVINPIFYRFAKMIQYIHQENTREHIEYIDTAACLLNYGSDGYEYYLRIDGNWQSQSLRFYPNEISLSIAS
jgi:hypothetical protein